MLSMVTPDALAAIRTSFVSRGPFPVLPELSVLLLLLLLDFEQLVAKVTRRIRRAAAVR